MTVIHDLKRSKSGTLTTSKTGEATEQQALSFTAGGNENGTTTLEDNLMGFLQN